MNEFVLDASLSLQWFLEDETDRAYSLAVLEQLAEKRASVPLLWFYEVGNGLLMAYRRKRIAFDQIEGFLARLKALPIRAVEQHPSEILDLPKFTQSSGLTNYDAAYLALAYRLNLPLATIDLALSKAATSAGVGLVTI